MAIGLFADVHGNLEALLAVKKDMEDVNLDEVWFLGDIVGYGPRPVECIEIVQPMAGVLDKGNHDDMTYLDVNPAWEGFRGMAAEAIKWTRKKLDEHKAQGGEDYRKFLGGLRDGYTDGKNLLVHGSPNDPISEYILKYKRSVGITYLDAFDLVADEKKRLFAAHAHDTWVYHAGLGSGLWCPKGNDSIKLPADEAAVIMIGSVGQPRDGDWRACWVLLDGDTIQFRRCEYDVEKVVQEIYSIPDLDNYLGDRLREGK